MKQTLEEIVNTFNSFITDKEKGVLWDADTTGSDYPYKERYRRVNYFIGQLVSENTTKTYEEYKPKGCPELSRDIAPTDCQRQLVDIWSYDTVENKVTYVTTVWEGQVVFARENKIEICYDGDYERESILFRDIKNSYEFHVRAISHAKKVNCWET